MAATAARIARITKEIFTLAIDIGVMREGVFPADSIYETDQLNSWFVNAIDATDNDAQSFYTNTRDSILGTLTTIFEEVQLNDQDDATFVQFRELLERTEELDEEFMESILHIHGTLKDDFAKLAQELKDADARAQAQSN